MTIKKFVVCALIGSLLTVGCQSGKQRADLTFEVIVEHPTFPLEQGPLVALDEGHHNFHTLDNRYRAFGRVLRKDGYRVASYPESFASLRETDIDVLVIANALSEKNRFQEDGSYDWSLPNPSAFEPEEIQHLLHWVEEGGALFLIVDHMPLPGCNQELAQAFGFDLVNGFAIDEELEREHGGIREAMRQGLRFDRENAGLAPHPISEGVLAHDSIPFVTSFTGHGFWGDEECEPILVLNETSVSLNPEVAWEFDEKTPRSSLAGALQGAVKMVGRGRVALFGEAAMFTAQVTGKQSRKMGLSSEKAPHNQQFLINILRWLSGIDELVGGRS